MCGVPHRGGFLHQFGKVGGFDPVQQHGVVHEYFGSGRGRFRQCGVACWRNAASAHAVASMVWRRGAALPIARRCRMIGPTRRSIRVEKMKFGFSAPVSGPLSRAEPMTRIAVEGEAMGYDYVTVSDHIVIPNDIAAKYPYSATGEFPSGARQERHEQLTALTWLAAKTKTIRLLTSVMVVPHRPAVLTAKILATVDVLSGGRIELGVGAGWMREEFEAVGAPPFDARGRVTDEYILAMLALWNDDNPEFHGEFVNFSNIAFEPKPPATGRPRNGPRIWVGGESGPALRRVAKLAMAGFQSAPIRRICWKLCLACRPASINFEKWSARRGAIRRRCRSATACRPMARVFRPLAPMATGGCFQAARPISSPIFASCGSLALGGSTSTIRARPWRRCWGV